MRTLIFAAVAIAIASPVAVSAQPAPAPAPPEDDIMRGMPRPDQIEDMANVASRAADAVLNMPIGGMVQAIDPTRRVSRDATIADVSGDPYLRDRVRHSMDDLTVGMGAMMAQVAVAAPAMRRSIEELERNLDRAMSDARRVRDRDYPDSRDYPDEEEYPRR